MVRKERFWDKTGGEGPWDYVVIGSGMGGMTAAAILARLGRRVLVLEQHYVPGGFTHTFTRAGYTWDVGVHAVGEVTSHSLPGRLLTDLTDGELRWASLGPVYDEFHFPDDVHIDFPDTPQQFRQNLIDAFPGQEEAIDGYLMKVKEVAGGMKGYYLARAAPKGFRHLAGRLLAGRSQQYFELNTQAVLDELTDDEHLKTVLAAQWGYYGSVPSRSSFAIQALVTKHFLYGGYYPVGGSGEIARTLLGRVASAGGWTRIYADVDEIVIEGGRAVGVRMKDGDTIRANKVISAAGVLSTVQRLLPARAREPWMDEVASLRPASAHVCLYLGFKGDIREAGASAANKWFWNTWDREVEAWNVSDPDALPNAPVLYTSFPSLKDPEHDPGPQVRHTGEVVTFVPYEAFERFEGSRWKKRGADYDAYKDKLQAHLLEQLLHHMPGLRPMLHHVELSTPASTQWFVRPVRGSIYGIEPTPDRFRSAWLKPRSPIPGLYFAGSEVASVGVVGALMGGVLAAAAAEPFPVLRYLRGVYAR